MVGAHDLPADRQPESDSVVAALFWVVNLDVAFEDLFEVLLGDTDALIAHLEEDKLFFGPGAQLDLAVVG